jgi:hypothetical protein
MFRQKSKPYQPLSGQTSNTSEREAEDDVELRDISKGDPDSTHPLLDEGSEYISLLTTRVPALIWNR